ncbi:MAG: phospholipid/cholesterol/gamma-HCH transport system substrate-binding protein [Hyphomicrobiaceae bacterium]|jgi:phospholipid/cholesterol/gamma-HCH transport system substrate-binding protein
MNDKTSRDVLVGTFVLAGIAALAWLSLTVGGLGQSVPGGLSLFARFDQISGLKTRAPVEIAGVKVGQVTSIVLGDDFRARVDLDLRPDLELPIDSSAAIVTAGLLGDKYVMIDLGAEDLALVSGEELSYTESAIVIERLIGKFLYNVGDEGEK